MPGTPKPGSGRWLKILLMVSLGINLLIAGMVVGNALNNKPSRPPSADTVAFLAFALPKEHRDALRAQLISRRAELRANRAALADMRRQMIIALEAKPFEMAAVEAILQRQRDLFLELGRLAHSALLERIEMLTPEERASYVESLKNNERRARR